MRLLPISVLLAASIAACSSPKADASQRAVPPAAAAAPSARAASPIVAGGTITGTIREVIPVESYVYLRLDTPTGEVWTAVNEAKLDVGATVTVYNVLLMEQFASPTLKRTFAKIYFGSTEPVTAPPQAPSAATAGTATGSSEAADAHVGAIAPATGSGANTIAMLWRAKDRLARTTVAVRGVVVKYNPGVMGKNWVHLQDGTGNAAAGTHDIAATTLDAAAVGDTITVIGTLRANVDVGAGYKYALLIENARVAGR